MGLDKQTLATEIQSAVDTAAGIATVVAPQYAGFIVLGQAIAHAAPELYADVQALLSKKEPTDADAAELAGKIADLLNPASL